jgi:solute carrier family 25 protein 14/30
MIAATFTNPVDVIKIRLQLQGEMGQAATKQYNNVFRAAYVIVTTEGFRGIYKGVSAAWLREGIYSGIRLGLYEPFKIMLGETDPKNTPLWLKFAAGSMAGAVGSVAGNPADMLKVRMQAWESTNP